MKASYARSASDRRSASRNGPTTAPPRVAPARLTTQLVALIGSVVGIVLGLTATLLLLGESASSSRRAGTSTAQPVVVVAPVPAVGPRPVAPSASAPPVPTPAVTPTDLPTAMPATTRAAIGDAPRMANAGAAVMLQEIAKLMEYGASRVDEVKPRVDALVQAFPGSPEAQQARQLLERSKAAFVEEAEGLLANAMAQAQDLLAKGRHDEAARSFKLVELRFADSEWYAQGAGARVGQMRARIKRDREELVASGRFVADDFSSDDVKWDLFGGLARANGALWTDDVGTSTAFPPMPEGRVITVSVTARIRSRIDHDDHAGAGLLIYHDSTHFWLLRLLIKEDGGLGCELHERMGPHWAAQQREPKLAGLGWTDCGWEMGTAYRLKIELTAEAIRGTIKDMGGKVAANIGYRFTNPAVTSGRPAIRASGCDVEFDDFEARISSIE